MARTSLTELSRQSTLILWAFAQRVYNGFVLSEEASIISLKDIRK
jgi:hypothetical protein